MGFNEKLTEFLKEHEYQAKHPEVWLDNAWKNKYYGLQNEIYEVMDNVDRLELQVSNLSMLERH